MGLKKNYDELTDTPEFSDGLAVSTGQAITDSSNIPRFRLRGDFTAIHSENGLSTAQIILDDSDPRVAIQNAPLQIDTGQAIEDGSGTERFDIQSNYTLVNDENEQPAFLGQYEKYNRIYAYSGQPVQIKDQSGDFTAVTYTTDASSPGTLELTNANINMKGNNILMGKTNKDNYTLQMNAFDANESTRIGFYGNDNFQAGLRGAFGELEAEDSAGNTTVLT